jgi:hypothetical protein
MAQLRSDLATDVREVRQSARVMTDWRFYVRRFPLATAAVALAVGYMLIPKRKEVKVISPDPNALAEMFKKEQLKVQAPASAKESPSMVKTLAMMGITWAAKAGMNYMGEQIRTAAMHKAHGPAESDPAPSPAAQPWPR